MCVVRENLRQALLYWRGRSREIRDCTAGWGDNHAGTEICLNLYPKSFSPTGPCTALIEGAHTFFRCAIVPKIGNRRGSYFLHPKATGWFARGELESRRDQGERYDISMRHMMPYTPYGVLEDLVPGAQFVTIMRDPLERFLSLFDFKAELKKRYKVRLSRCNVLTFAYLEGVQTLSPPLH